MRKSELFSLERRTLLISIIEEGFGITFTEFAKIYDSTPEEDLKATKGDSRLETKNNLSPSFCPSKQCSTKVKTTKTYQKLTTSSFLLQPLSNLLKTTNNLIRRDLLI